jgi:hypothetical protein
MSRVRDILYGDPIASYAPGWIERAQRDRAIFDQRFNRAVERDVNQLVQDKPHLFCRVVRVRERVIRAVTARRGMAWIITTDSGITVCRRARWNGERYTIPKTVIVNRSVPCPN